MWRIKEHTSIYAQYSAIFIIWLYIFFFEGKETVIFDHFILVRFTKIGLSENFFVNTLHYIWRPHYRVSEVQKSRQPELCKKKQKILMILIFFSPFEMHKGNFISTIHSIWLTPLIGFRDLNTTQKIIKDLKTSTQKFFLSWNPTNAIKNPKEYDFLPDLF